VTKLAYCLLVHKNPHQVKRLINKLFSPSDQFYLNIFGNHSEEIWPKSLEEFKSDNFFVTQKYSKAWGMFELVQVTLNSMKYFASKNYDYFINLSGQCYPLWPVEEIHSFFSDKTYAYLNEFSLPDEAPSGWGKSGGLERFQNSYYKNPFFPIIKALFKINKLMFIKIPRFRRAIPGNLKPYGGSMWFCLHKNQVNYILDYVNRNPEIINFFKNTLCSDEIFFQTLLMNSKYKNSVINDNLRFIDWSTSDISHPSFQTVANADKLLESTKLFARKFDTEIDEAILDIIDRRMQ
jgi:hypothetical protein